MIIEVMAASSNGSLNLIVSDDGPGLLSSRPSRSGIGLANTRSRLARLYGDSAHLVIESAPGRGVRAVTMHTANQADGANPRWRAG